MSFCDNKLSKRFEITHKAITMAAQFYKLYANCSENWNIIKNVWSYMYVAIHSLLSNECLFFTLKFRQKCLQIKLAQLCIRNKRFYPWVNREVYLNCKSRIILTIYTRMKKELYVISL